MAEPTILFVIDKFLMKFRTYTKPPGWSLDRFERQSENDFIKLKNHYKENDEPAPEHIGLPALSTLLSASVGFQPSERKKDKAVYAAAAAEYLYGIYLDFIDDPKLDKEKFAHFRKHYMEKLTDLKVDTARVDARLDALIENEGKLSKLKDYPETELQELLDRLEGDDIKTTEETDLENQIMGYLLDRATGDIDLEKLAELSSAIVYARAEYTDEEGKKRRAHAMSEHNSAMTLGILRSIKQNNAFLASDEILDYYTKNRGLVAASGIYTTVHEKRANYNRFFYPGVAMGVLAFIFAYTAWFNINSGVASVFTEGLKLGGLFPASYFVISSLMGLGVAIIGEIGERLAVKYDMPHLATASRYVKNVGGFISLVFGATYMLSNFTWMAWAAVAVGGICLLTVAVSMVRNKSMNLNHVVISNPQTGTKITRGDLLKYALAAAVVAALGLAILASPAVPAVILIFAPIIGAAYMTRAERNEAETALNKLHIDKPKDVEMENLSPPRTSRPNRFAHIPQHDRDFYRQFANKNTSVQAPDSSSDPDENSALHIGKKNK